MLTYIYVCLFVLTAGYALAAPPTAGSIERSQEMIREDEALRRKIEQQEKFFVKKIIISPFQGHWLTKEDIQQIMDSLKVNGSYELKKDSTLEITVKELTQ